MVSMQLMISVLFMKRLININHVLGIQRKPTGKIGF